MTRFTLSDLEAIIAERAGAEDEGSYTRLLVTKGIEKCAEKVGEEAVEVVIAAVKGDQDNLKNEAADLLYHLLVVLNVADVPLDEVMATLAGRTGQTGLEEKASR